MNSSDYTQKMKDLRKRVSQYVQIPKKQIGIMNICIPTVNTKAAYFYILPPCLILIVLIIGKPFFIMKKNTDENGIVTKKINYKKLAIYVLVSGMIIDIGLFFVLKKVSKL